MKHQQVLFFLLLAFCVHASDAFRILCVFPFNSRSHFRMFDALCTGLARKGHNIDMISHFPKKDPIPNYRDVVDLSGTMKNIVNSLSVNHAIVDQTAMTYYIATKYGGDLCHLLGLEKMQDFIKNQRNNPPYDLLITEYLGSPCYLGLGELFDTPVAIAISFLEAPYVDDFLKSPFNFAFFPGSMINNAVLTTFFDRFWNFVTNFKEMQLFYYYTSDQTEIMRKYLGNHLSDVRELEKNVSLAFVNSHHSLHGARPLTASIIEVGGLHIYGDEEELSEELYNWLESADHGLVYFTLGSLVNIESLPTDTMLGLYRSFAKISPVKVLMRCANVTNLPSGLPSNVLTSPWIPQMAVLKHRNTKAFITHGGLMGTQEAVYYGVPTIGIPLFADQMRNVNIMVHKNMGILLSLKDINEHSMDAALNAILHDPKYREAARNLSELFKDRPLNALDTGIYWVECVIRNGPDTFKSPLADVPWWKLNLVDILAFLIIFIVLFVYLSVILLKIAFKKFYKTSTQLKTKLN